jgi:hypothetical protein
MSWRRTEMTKRKLSEIIRALVGNVKNKYADDGDETIPIRKGTLILWAEELERMGN